MARRDATAAAARRAHTVRRALCRVRTAHSPRCVRFARLADTVLCQDCVRNPEASTLRVAGALQHVEQQQRALHELCATCADSGTERPPCVAYDCALVYARSQNDAQVAAHRALLTTVQREARAIGDPWMW